MVCPSCGTQNPPGQKFCGECGARVDAQAPSAASSPAGGPSVVGREAATAERRLVSVLFADLVGFTTLSEDRDPEEVRDLLTRYFDASRQLIGRYGGTVEKFIGDAVMAVWGTPVAQEDDAERAVRAALDLTDAVTSLGAEAGVPGLRARAGVLTGEAAVTVGAEGQGMVAGDLVNSASRIQAAAPPGFVFVGEETKRATESAVAYEDAGAHELKGKAEPVRLWRALRVVAAKGGSRRVTGLEAPFVGRDRELRLLKELFHATAEDRTARLVSVTGIAGIGKSRLSWEFEKYVDGLAQNTWWHRGRCLAYGEGVAYWALAEMVRMRAGIAEGEPPDVAHEKLRAVIAQLMPDPEEQGWVEPRLAHLLGIEEHVAREQADLFSAWRLFFERVAEQRPTILLFEDLQWADAGLLDFIEYLLEWSKDHALFILTLARPELQDRRPTWGAGRRNFISAYLDPLATAAMEALLRGLVPGLPDELRTRILDRAEGVPLYAVETVRMLLDRGLLKKDGSEYRLTEHVVDLEVPQTLHALIAARLDGLAAEERWLLQVASVMGKTFSKPALAAVTSIPATEMDTLLTSLVRKEVLQVQADPRSPERGQYGFLQDLVKRVAYETLSKKERKAKHLAVASYLQTSSGYEEDEVVEVIASHYTEAYRAAPDAPDAEAIKENARTMLARAGEHAASLAANEEAQHYFEQGAELAEDPATRAELLERAGMMGRMGGRSDMATDRFEQAIALFEQAGHTHAAARVSARHAEIMWQTGRLADAVDRMEQAFETLKSEEPDEDLAMFAAQLARLLFFSGHSDRALERLEIALDIAEGLGLPEVLSQALNTKGVVMMSRGRGNECVALMEFALKIALENDLSSAALRAFYNLADQCIQTDRHQDGVEYVQRGLALARKIGNRLWEWQMLGQFYPFTALGQWDEALEMIGSIPEERLDDVRTVFTNLLIGWSIIHLNRGELSEAAKVFDRLSKVEASADVQERASLAVAHGMRARAEGRHEDALKAAEEAFGDRELLGFGSEIVKEAFVLATESALTLGDATKAEELLTIVEEVPPGRLPPFLDAQAKRFRARLAEQRGADGLVEQLFKAATGVFRELATPFSMATTLLEHGQWLVAQGRVGEAKGLLDEAREIFARLKATPWLERVEQASSAWPESEAVTGRV